jgi:hypothetical protein
MRWVMRQIMPIIDAVLIFASFGFPGRFVYPTMFEKGIGWHDERF